MDKESFHKILLCIVNGSEKIFGYSRNCVSCNDKNICDEIIEIYFKHQKNDKKEEVCITK